MLKFLTEGVILSNILFRRPVPNPLVGYGKVYNSYVRERGKVNFRWYVNKMSSMRVSVCVTKYKLFICPKVRVSVGVVHCWVSTIGQ